MKLHHYQMSVELMKRFALLITLLLLFPFAAAATPKIEKESFTSQDKKRTFYLFVPETTKPVEALPMLVLLHVSGHNGLSLVESWKDLASKEGLVLAGPDSNDPSRWTSDNDGPNMIHDLVETVKSRCPIDPRRVYLFGHSAGAVYAIKMSLMESEYFAASAVHAGSFRERKEFEVISRATRKIPLAIWVGTADQYFSLKSIRETRDALVGRGFPFEVTEVPGHDHNYYDLAQRINEAAWQFLKKYRLPTDQRFEEYPDSKEMAAISKRIAEINGLKARVNDLTDRVNLKELEINGKDISKQRTEIVKIAQDETSLLTEAAIISRAEADKAEQFAGSGLSERNRKYLSLTAQQARKYAEMLDAKREQVELWFGNESPELINTRRAEAQKRIEKFWQEADDLQKQADRIMH